jgi:hypothetical protein
MHRMCRLWLPAAGWCRCNGISDVVTFARTASRHHRLIICALEIPSIFFPLHQLKSRIIIHPLDARCIIKSLVNVTIRSNDWMIILCAAAPGALPFHRIFLSRGYVDPKDYIHNTSSLLFYFFILCFGHLCLLEGRIISSGQNFDPNTSEKNGSTIYVSNLNALSSAVGIA